MDQQTSNRIIRLKQVINITGLSRSCIYSYMDKGLFPNSINLGGRNVGWLEKDIQGWIEQRIQASNI